MSASNKPDPSANDAVSPPPIRRPVIFYLAVILAFGLLGAAVLALIL